MNLICRRTDNHGLQKNIKCKLSSIPQEVKEIEEFWIGFVAGLVGFIRKLAFFESFLKGNGKFE